MLLMAETLINRFASKPFMGIFEDVKSSIGGSKSGSESQFNSSKFDSSFDSDPQNQPIDRNRGRSDPNDTSFNEGGGMQGSRSGNLDQGVSHNSQSMDRDRSREGSGQNAIGRRQGDLPNPRAGRPQEGGTQPQLSPETEKEMRDAGFRMDGGQDRGRRSESVADRRDDLEQIKSQNQQIIELLKRINSSLNGSNGTMRHGGRR